MTRSHKIQRKAVVVTTLFSMLAMLLPLPTNATAFNPNLIMTDWEMRDYNAMSFVDIVAFLNGKGGLNNYFDVDMEDQLLKGTAQLIDDAAKRHFINPKYVLVVLQKESSIVETYTPTERQLDWAAGYALCDGCYRSSPLAQKYKGFANQIEAAAGSIDWYMTNSPNMSHLKQPGISYTFSGQSVTPANLATAGMYDYTPHLHGNQLFYNIWQRWFGAGVGEIRFPDGTLIMNQKNGAYALIQAGTFRAIQSKSVLETRFGNRAPVVMDEYAFRALEETNPGRPLSFPDLSLVSDENGTVYLLIGNQRRPIASDEVFRSIGFHPEEVEEVALVDIEDYELGQPITLESAYPLGQLVQDNSTGGIWYVESGVRRAIWDRSILATRFGERSIIQADPAELEQFQAGDPVTFPDGTLAKSPDDPAVFVISAGQRRRIPSEEVFLGYGYRWNSIVTCNDRALALHPYGEPLLLFDETVVATAVGL